MSITIETGSSTNSDHDPAPSAWAWLGVHGGAGVTTLTEAVPGGLECLGGWPTVRDPGVVVLVCRTHVRGLLAALDTAQAWTAGRVGEDVLLAGVVAIADAAEDLQRSQREALTLLGGLVPHLWRIPWIPHLRVARPNTGTELATHPAFTALAHDLSTIRPRINA